MLGGSQVGAQAFGKEFESCCVCPLIVLGFIRFGVKFVLCSTPSHYLYSKSVCILPTGKEVVFVF